MSRLRAGIRVSLADKKGKKAVKGVLAVREATYFIVVLDEAVVERESSERELEYADAVGVDPRRCIFVPFNESSRIEHLWERSTAKPDATFICSLCTRPVRRRDVIFLCLDHHACWHHLIPENPDPRVLQQLVEALRLYAADISSRLTEEDARIRALLMYDRYCAAQGDQRQQLVVGVMLRDTYNCRKCGVGIRMELVAKQFSKRVGTEQSWWGKLSDFVRSLLGDSQEPEAQPHLPSLDKKAQFHAKCVENLADGEEDRELCAVAVSRAERKAPANVTEGRFLALCYDELRSLKNASTVPDEKLGRMNCKDALMSSTSPPAYKGDAKPTEVKHFPQLQQARPKSGSPRQRSGQPASSTLIRDAKDEEKFVRRMAEFGVTDAVAIRAIAAAKANYPRVADEDRFFGYCMDEAMETRPQSPPDSQFDDAKPPAKADDRSSHGIKNEEHTSPKIYDHKGSFDGRTEPHGYATRSNTKSAMKAQYRARLTEHLLAMSYSHHDIHDAIDRVLARDGYLLDEPSQDKALDELVLRCLDELRDVQPVPAEPEFERHTSQEGYTLPATVAANVGQALASDAAVPDQPPMDIERGNSYTSSHNDEEQKHKAYAARPDCVTEAEVRISARCARANSPVVEKVPKGTSYDGLREMLLQKFQQHFADPDAADPSNYKIYLEQERDFSVEIVPPSFGEREEATVLVTELRKDNKVNIWHVNENVGPKQPLVALASNFKFNRSMQRKITELQEAYGYEGWRRIRGDGNCYYRAVLFGYLEQVVAHPRRTELLDAFLQMVEAIQFDTGSEDAEQHEALLQELRAAIKETRWKTGADFRARILDPTTGIDRALVLAVRRVIGAYLLDHAQDDFNGITLADTILSSYDVADMADYVERCVLTLGEDAEGSFVYLGIMFKALGIGGRTVFLDRRDDVDLTILRTPEEEMPVNVHLLLRPGHYDLLYVAPEMPAKAEAGGGESEGNVSSASA